MTSPTMKETLIPVRPQQRRSLATAANLAQALRNLLETSRFEDLSVAEIARVAGVSVGGFYGRFPSKEALLVHLVETDVAESLLEEAAQVLGAPGGPLEPTPFDLIRDYLTFVADVFEGHRAVLRPLSLISRARPQDGALQLVAAANERVHALFLDALRRHSAEIRHPDPEAGMRLALLWCSAALREVVLFQEPVSRLAAPAREALVEELSRSVAAYLGLEAPARG